MNDEYAHNGTIFGPPVFRSSRRGMTVIELMVASVIIVILILAVGNTLSGLQQMVRVAQTTIRANAKAAAMGDVLYQDIRRASQNGFICITQAAGGSPQLYILDMGPTASVAGGNNGNGGLSCLGQTTNGGGIPLVWHITYVLNNSTSSLDSMNADAGVAQSYSRVIASSTIDLAMAAVPADNAATAVVTLPPNTLADMNNMWKVLNTYATDLSITWSDGTTDPSDKTRLMWYGIDRAITGGAAGIVAKDSGWGGNDSTMGKPEFSVGGKYRALFCHDEPSAWPVAIKIRFKLTDPDAPKDFDLGGTNMQYEVICPVGQ